MLSLLSAYSWQSLVSGPHPDCPGCPEKIEINPFKHPKQLLFQQLRPKINPWGLCLLMSYSWQSLVSGPQPDGPGCPEKVEINLT